MKDYIQKIINAFTSTKHSEEVTREVHQWLVDEEYADEKQAALHAIWEKTEGKEDGRTLKSLTEVYRKVGIGKKNSIKRIHLKRWEYAAAAIVVIGISVFSTFFVTKNRYSEVAMIEKFTPVGEMNLVELPDGSKVRTNSGTLLLYPEVFKGDTRTVYVIGEANFIVAKNPDKPFIVKANTMAVTALGTEFNISAYPENDEIIATLIHGKIRVNCNSGIENYILDPAEQVIYNTKNKKGVLTNANLEDVIAWQKGITVFRGMTMKEVFSSLERTYGVTFQYNISLFDKDKYNFRFRQNSKIDEVMVIIQEVVGSFTYKLEDGVCYIKPINKK